MITGMFANVEHLFSDDTHFVLSALSAHPSSSPRLLVTEKPVSVPMTDCSLHSTAHSSPSAD